jgi:hypothetical protein
VYNQLASPFPESCPHNHGNSGSLKYLDAEHPTVESNLVCVIEESNHLGLKFHPKFSRYGINDVAERRVKANAISQARMRFPEITYPILQLSAPIVSNLKQLNCTFQLRPSWTESIRIAKWKHVTCQQGIAPIPDVNNIWVSPQLTTLEPLPQSGEVNHDGLGKRK